MRTRRRLWLRNHREYSALADVSNSASPELRAWTSDMDIEIPPYCLKGMIEGRHLAQVVAGDLTTVNSVESHDMLRFNSSRAPRHHQNSIGHSDSLVDVMGHQYGGLSLAPDDLDNLIGYRDPGLKIER